MARQLYVAYDLDGGDLIGAIWAESELKALDYFFSRPALIPDQQDRLYLEPIEKSDWTIQELAEIDPEIAENDDYGFICNAYDSDIDIDRLIGSFNESRKPKHFSDALFTDLELPTKFTEAGRSSKKAVIGGATLREARKSTIGAFDEAALTACLNRITANAAESSEPEVDKFGASINVKLSKEDLKKALRIGSRGGYTDGSGITMPAQLVDLISLEIDRLDNDGICVLNIEISGENEETGESTHDYNDGDIPFVGGKYIPGTPIESDDEFISYVRQNIVPNAEKIAHEIIEDTWNELGINDYVGITDYNDTEDVSDSEWATLLAYADALLKKLINSSGNRNYDDGDGYWQSEYDTWCFRYLYNKDTLKNTAQLDKLCNDFSKKLPNVDFYWNEDEGVSEIGYIATRDE